MSANSQIRVDNFSVAIDRAMRTPSSVSGSISRCFLPFASGYFLSYAFRTVNATISPQLTRELGLDPASIGAMTSAFFATFALAQIPLGLALDRWGPRRTEAVLLSVAVIGAVIFSEANEIAGLVVGRALIGFGMSACLMAAFKANASCWDAKRLPLANGVLMGFGGLGAICATVPAEWMIAAIDWRNVIRWMTGATAVVAAVIWFASTEISLPHDRAEAIGRQIEELCRIARNNGFWRYAALTGLTHGTYLAYQTLWAAAWMQDVAHLDRPTVLTGMALVTGAMTVGYPALGLFADWMGRRGVSIDTTFKGFTAAFIVLQIPLAFGWGAAPLATWAVFGFLGCGTVLGYAALTQTMPARMSGRINAAVNLVVFLLAFAAQWAVGATLSWDYGTLESRHALAMGVLIGLQALAWLWFIFARSPSSGK